MIITKIKGGLGNQMFQYAAGRQLSIKHNTDLKLDLNHYLYNQARKYQLDIFGIKSKRASHFELSLFKRNPNTIKSRIICFAQDKLFEKKIIKEPDNNFGYYDKFNDSKDNTYIDGYWQSECYFKEVSDIIRKEFTFQSLPQKKNLNLIREMKSEISVSMHIRRGDYVTDSYTSEVHGVLPKKYYENAIEIISSKIKNFQLYIFSDDINWVSENLNFGIPAKYIDHNKGDSDYEDMRLMSDCKHNIIANSSFSWWGAWLNRSKDKIVIAPRNWFNFKSAIHKVKYGDLNIIPDKWIKI